LPIQLAVVPNLEIEGFRRIPATSEEFRLVGQRIETLYRENELRLIGEVEGEEWSKRARTAAAASRQSAELRWLYRRTSNSTPAIYYFEAVRELKDAEPLRGLKFTGWLRSTAQGPLEALTLRGGVYDAESAEANRQPVQIPRGLLQIGARTFWIMSAIDYEWFGFHLYEVMEQEVRRLLTSVYRSC